METKKHLIKHQNESDSNQVNLQDDSQTKTISNMNIFQQKSDKIKPATLTQNVQIQTQSVFVDKQSYNFNTINTQIKNVKNTLDIQQSRLTSIQSSLNKIISILLKKDNNNYKNNQSIVPQKQQPLNKQTLIHQQLHHQTISEQKQRQINKYKHKQNSFLQTNLIKLYEINQQIICFIKNHTICHFQQKSNEIVQQQNYHNQWLQQQQKNEKEKIMNHSQEINQNQETVKCKVQEQNHYQQKQQQNAENFLEKILNQGEEKVNDKEIRRNHHLPDINDSGSDIKYNRVTQSKKLNKKNSKNPKIQKGQLYLSFSSIDNSKKKVPQKKKPITKKQKNLTQQPPVKRNPVRKRKNLSQQNQK